MTLSGAVFWLTTASTAAVTSSVGAAPSAALTSSATLAPRCVITCCTAGSDSEASDRSVEVLVFGLRRKLDAAGVPGLIETRRGAGYLIP